MLDGRNLPGPLSVAGLLTSSITKPLEEEHDAAHLRFSGLTLTVSIETDPPMEGFDPVSPGQGAGGLYEWRTEVTAPDADSRLLRWSLRRRDGAPFEVVNCTVSTGVPAVDLHRVFVPALYEAIGKRDLISLPWGVEERTFAAWSFPFIALLNRDDGNRFCIGFMDHVRAADIRQSCYDEDAAVELKRPSLKTSEWRDGVYLSRAPRHLFDAVRAFARQYDRFHQVRIAGAPAASWDPVWCSWYGIKGDVDAAYILGMAPLLRDWGFGSIIVDDGWFVRDHFDEETGHYIADESKFPDMAGLARQVQEEGLRILLWCAPIFRLGEIVREPFVAGHLFHPEGQERPEQFLCPRCPEVRAYAARMVGHLLRTYPVDGLKIDFIDPLRELASQPCQAAHAHDIDDFGEAVQTLLAEMHRSITAVRPDALIEFRMNYSTLGDAPLRHQPPRPGRPLRRRPHPPHVHPSEELHPRSRGRPRRQRRPAHRPGLLAAAGAGGERRPLHGRAGHQRRPHAVDGPARPAGGAQAGGARLARVVPRAPRPAAVRTPPGARRRCPPLAVLRAQGGGGRVGGIFTPDAPGVFELPSPQVRRLWILNGSSRGRLCCRLEGWRTERLEVGIRDRFLAERQGLRLPVDGGAADLDIEVEIGGALELTA